MHRAPLGQLAMDGGNINDHHHHHHQSMSQLLQSCTALHAVANNNNQNNNNNNQETMTTQIQVRKLNSNTSSINDENRGPNDASPTMGGALQSNAKADLVDLSQLAAMRKNRAPTMSRRNERERNRVRYLNFTFDVLRQHLPGKGGKGKAKKMSKVDTLRGAIDYIHDLQILLGDDMEDGNGGVANNGCNATSESGASNSLSQTGTESEGDSLSPSGSPGYSGESPGVGHDQLSDEEGDLGPLAGWFC